MLVDETRERAEQLSKRFFAPDTGQRLGSPVHVVNPALRIGRQQAFAERIERELRAARQQ
ncbi:MAG: hypothetical protein EXR87_05230 [Gammaproteobacteria bacterium]|nr:hypothetical protein [Gammaproteobacteria bacterium]